jgi:hypothetical protein
VGVVAKTIANIVPTGTTKQRTISRQDKKSIIMDAMRQHRDISRQLKGGHNPMLGIGGLGGDKGTSGRQLKADLDPLAYWEYSEYPWTKYIDQRQSKFHKRLDEMLEEAKKQSKKG